MPTPNLTIIGPGRLGRSLANCLLQANLVTIKQVYSRDQNDAVRAVAIIGSGTPISTWSAIAPCDLIMLSVADEAIADVVTELAAQNVVNANTIFFHVSGIHTSSLLEPLTKLGATVASLYPVRSFSGEELAPVAFAGTCCALEGNEKAKNVLRDLFTRAGAQVFNLAASDKPLYHAAMVLMANYTVTLTVEAATILQSIGITEGMTKQILLPLLDSVVTNLHQLPLRQALTGPLARGEDATIVKHLQALPAGKVKDLYRLLGEITVADVLSFDAHVKERLARLLR